MSHVPFVTFAPEPEALGRDSAVNPDRIRESSDSTANPVSSSSATSILMASDASSSRSRLPASLRFALIAVVSLGSSASLYSLVPDLAGVELAKVSRSLNEPWQIAALLAWRITDLWIQWASGFDYFDVLNFTLLTYAPYYTLLAIFYEISLWPVFLALGIDLFSNALPFFLLRPLAPHNAAMRSPSTGSAALAANTPIRFYITLFAAAIYGVVVYSALYTWLPVYLITHFDSIRTLEFAHNAALPVLVTSFIPLGYAAKDFLFAASIASARTEYYSRKTFEARTASLVETLAWNVGLTGWGTRESVLTSRTALLVVVTLANAFARVYGTIEGAEEWGALGWGGVFALAATLTGVGFAWIGDV